MSNSRNLAEILDFIAEYTTTLLGSGVNTSRVLRCSQRIGEALNVKAYFSTFQKSTTLSVRDVETGEVLTLVVPIPVLPISFQKNAELGAISWDALDEKLDLAEIRRRVHLAKSKPRIHQGLVLILVAFANASMCRLFGGDWAAVGIVFVATFIGFSTRLYMLKKHVNHFLLFTASAFVASLVASSSLLIPGASSETALATSVLFLVPGVPLINGVIDIVDGHILIGISRLVNAALLVVCIAIGLSATLLLVRNSLL